MSSDSSRPKHREVLAADDVDLATIRQRAISI